MDITEQPAVKAAMNSTNDQSQSYDLRLRILGNEVFAISLSSSSTSSRWIVIATVSLFSTLVLLGAYGEKLVNLYRSLTQ